VVIADPGGAIQGSKSLRWSDFTQQQAEAIILAVEVANNYPLWMDPSALKAPDAIRLYTDKLPWNLRRASYRGIIPRRFGWMVRGNGGWQRSVDQLGYFNGGMAGAD
jgi:hypothetical protein